MMHGPANVKFINVSRDVHKVPNIKFHADVFQDYAYATNKCNYTSIHLYAVTERGGPTLPFKYLSHAKTTSVTKQVIKKD